MTVRTLNGRRACMVMALALLCASGANTDLRAQAPRATTEPAGDKVKGRARFVAVGCYQCHANEAQGGATGPRIGPNPLPWPRFTAYVRAPRGEMPPYTVKALSEQDLADIYAFLKAQPGPASLPDFLKTP